MKIQCNETISLDLDPEHLANAGPYLVELRAKCGENLLNAVFVLLLFRELEKAKPGFVATLQKKIAAEIKRKRSPRKSATRKK
jgi:hypothetical protein